MKIEYGGYKDYIFFDDEEYVEYVPSLKKVKFTKYFRQIDKTRITWFAHCDQTGWCYPDDQEKIEKIYQRILKYQERTNKLQRILCDIK